MSWEDRYVRGSFRGLPFFTTRTDIRAGQRRAVYEIPFDSRGAASIDLGRKPRKFSIDCFLLNSNIDQQAKQFLEALEQPGPGLLVHPYLGRMMVIPADEISVSLSNDAGGKADIHFEATESRAAQDTTSGPFPQPSPRTDVPKATAALRQANQESFEAHFALKSVADFVKDANVGTLETVLLNLSSINNTISAALSVPGELASEIDAISLQLVSLGDTPDKLYATVAGVIEKVFVAVARVAGRSGIDVSLSGSTARPDPVSVTLASLKAAIAATALTDGSLPAGQRDTPARARERENRAALDQMTAAAALAAVIDGANEVDLPADADNEAVRDLLLAALDTLFLQELESSVSDAIQDVRAQVWARYTGTGTELTEYTPRDDLPADVIAWQLYGDAERMQEIVDRNAVSDPGAVPGLAELVVLAK